MGQLKSTAVQQGKGEKNPGESKRTCPKYCFLDL